MSYNFFRNAGISVAQATMKKTTNAATSTPFAFTTSHENTTIPTNTFSKPHQENSVTQQTVRLRGV